MTTIGFIRHGCTAWNKEGRAQGCTDVPLDEEGMVQAEKLADRLNPNDWDVIYASDLLRAKQTAETINQKIRKGPIHFDPRIRELGVGKVEGTTEAERVKKWGPNWKELDMDLETMESVYERGNAFLEEVIQKHEGKSILVVSHGSFTKRMLIQLLPQHDMDISLENGSITIVEKRADGWHLTLHNCVQHLVEQVEKR